MTNMRTVVETLFNEKSPFKVAESDVPGNGIWITREATEHSAYECMFITSTTLEALAEYLAAKQDAAEVAVCEWCKDGRNEDAGDVKETPQGAFHDGCLESLEVGAMATVLRNATGRTG